VAFDPGDLAAVGLVRLLAVDLHGATISQAAFADRKPGRFQLHYDALVGFQAIRRAVARDLARFDGNRRIDPALAADIYRPVICGEIGNRDTGLGIVGDDAVRYLRGGR